VNLHPHFLDRNQLRNYPLQGRRPLVDEAGVRASTAVLAAARFTVPAGVTGLYFQQVRHSGRSFSALVHRLPEDRPVGYFGVVVDRDFQPVELAVLEPGFFGRVVLGPLSAFDGASGLHTFSPEIGRVEDSLVIPVPAPPVTGLRLGNHVLSGRVGLAYVNVREAIDAWTITLDVPNRSQVLAVNDRSVRYGTCGFPAVGGLNGVAPDAAGNIDLYGILPLVVTVTADGQISATIPGMTRDDLCGRPEVIPPANPSDTYHAAADLPVVGVPVVPEWRSWPGYALPS
jgi:hypothetical protein